MQHTDQIQALSEFLLEYATTLMGAGGHTNRAVRNLSRRVRIQRGHDHFPAQYHHEPDLQG